MDRIGADCGAEGFVKTKDMVYSTAADNGCLNTMTASQHFDRSAEGGRVQRNDPCVPEVDANTLLLEGGTRVRSCSALTRLPIKPDSVIMEPIPRLTFAVS